MGRKKRTEAPAINQISWEKVWIKNIKDISKYSNYYVGSYMMKGLIMCVCHKGSATFHINQETKMISKGMISLVLPEQIITFDQATDDLDVSVLYLPQDFIDEQIQANPIQLMEGMQNAMVKVSESVRQDIQALLEILNKYISMSGKRQPERIAALIVSTIANIINVTSRQVMLPTPSSTRQAALTKKFFDSLSKNYMEQHEVSYYAEQVGVTPKYLSTALRNSTGHGAQEWISRMVVFHAKKMLCSSFLSIAEIAEAMSFSSASAFIRFFKNQTGTTPLAYRK